MSVISVAPAGAPSRIILIETDNLGSAPWTRPSQKVCALKPFHFYGFDVLGGHSMDNHLSVCVLCFNWKSFSWAHLEQTGSFRIIQSNTG